MWNPFRRRRCRATTQRLVLERLDTVSQQLDTLEAAVDAEATAIAIRLINGQAAQVAPAG